jgi:predicted helicase
MLLCAENVAVQPMTGATHCGPTNRSRLDAKQTLVLVPSLSLLAQTLREWTANSRSGFDFLPVCSDKTVAELEVAVETTSDLGFPVTTDPEAHLCQSALVSAVSIQSLRLLSLAGELTLNAFEAGLPVTRWYI